MIERLTGSTDSGLLAEYLAGGPGSAAAFEELVRRHGGMVYQTCRRVLGSHEAAEDASQAAFLVLARRAGAVRGAIEPWLHGVAMNCARAARRSERARRGRELVLRSERSREAEKEVAAMPAQAGAPEPSGDWKAIRPQLDEEVGRLPAGQRRAVVLHYLEGRTQREVAGLMGLSEGAVASHLHRATERLRERFAQRGTVVSTAAFGPMLAAGCAAAAPCPAFLLAAAAKLPAAGAAGAAGAGAVVIGAEVSALAKGAMQIMFWSKVKLVAAVAAAAAILGAATPLAVLALSGEDAGKAPAPAPAAADPAAPAAERKVDAPVVDGLRIGLVAGPEVLACSDACRRAPAGGQYHACAGTCGLRCEGRFKLCWGCAANAGLCQVCGDKKLPAGAMEVTELKAGETLMLALVFENVSKEKLRVCDYMLTTWKLKWQIAGPDAGSVRTSPTGVQFMLAAIDAANFPEVAPGARRYFGVRLAGNPPAINQGTSITHLLKAGAYKLSAAYSNQEDSYFDNQKKQKVQPPGKVWKGEIRTAVLDLKVTGEVQPAPAGPGLGRPLFAN